ncbi:MAG TPA: alpha/beta fold hydrolase [Oculatellaceae cyanobacterium]
MSTNKIMVAAGFNLIKLFVLLALTLFQTNFAEAGELPKALRGNGETTEYALGLNDAPVLVSWQAPAEERAIVLAVHGFGFNKYAYKQFAERIQSQGISTYALDVRGFGDWTRFTSSGTQLDLEAGVQDVKDLLISLRAVRPNTPIFLLGESMGGALALHVAAESPELVDGVISSVPSNNLRGKNLFALKVVLKVLAKPFGRVDIGQQLMSRATNDQALRKDLLSDSEIRTKVSSTELLRFWHFMKNNHCAAMSISGTPVLMVQGDNDQLIDSDGTRKLFEELPTPDKSMMLVKGGSHLTFEEGQFTEQTIAQVSDWMTKHVTATAMIASR